MKLDPIKGIFLELDFFLKQSMNLHVLMKKEGMESKKKRVYIERIFT